MMHIDDRSLPVSKGDILDLKTEVNAHTERRLDDFRMEVRTRFEQSERRLEDLKVEMITRFEQSDRHHEDFKVEVNTRFQQFEHRMDGHFSEMEGRLVTTLYRLGESFCGPAH